jgi:glucose dehydrogenase
MKLLALVLLSTLFASAQVPFARIVNADKEPGNWLSYSRTLDGQRYSPLTEIDTKNVAHLRVKWAYQFADPHTEVSPIVVDGILYLTGPNSAMAIDGRSGRSLWQWSRPLPADYHHEIFVFINVTDARFQP